MSSEVTSYPFSRSLRTRLMPRKPALTTPPLVERYLDALWMERGLSENTLAAYRNDLSRLAAWLAGCGTRRLLTARRQDLLDYLSRRVGEGARPRTTARLLSSLRRFFRKVLERDPIVIPLVARV